MFLCLFVCFLQFHDFFNYFTSTFYYTRVTRPYILAPLTCHFAYSLKQVVTLKGILEPAASVQQVKQRFKKQVIVVVLVVLEHQKKHIQFQKKLYFVKKLLNYVQVQLQKVQQQISGVCEIIFHRYFAKSDFFWIFGVTFYIFGGFTSFNKRW